MMRKSSRGWIRTAVVGAIGALAVIVALRAVDAFGESGLPSVVAAQAAPTAREVVGTAARRMGGEAELRGVEQVRLRMMTQWQRQPFSERPGLDRPSFEPHTDLRDYRLPAWRNTRELSGVRIVNIVRDSVAITDFGRGFGPQSVAYVDERDELFLYTPDRLVLALLDSPDLRSAGDTTLAGEPHRLVRATLEPVGEATVAFHAGTGLPTVLAFRAGHPNDFGLVPWGEMEVEVWYAGWRTFGEISIPTQWDIFRVGEPYKRMTVRRAEFDAAIAADSFAIPADLRRAFLDSRGPMHDRHVDSVSVRAPGLVAVHGRGFPTVAVRTGENGDGAGWHLFGAARHPLMLARARAALADEGVDDLAGVIVASSSRAGNGGVVRLVREGVPVLASRSAEPFVRTMLANAGLGDAAFDVVREGRWVGEGDGRLRLEPFDLPDAPGSLLAFSPSLGWLYAPDAVTPLDARLALDRARELGFEWRALGTARGVIRRGELAS